MFYRLIWQFMIQSTAQFSSENNKYKDCFYLQTKVSICECLTLRSEHSVLTEYCISYFTVALRSKETDSIRQTL